MALTGLQPPKWTRSFLKFQVPDKFLKCTTQRNTKDTRSSRNVWVTKDTSVYAVLLRKLKFWDSAFERKLASARVVWRGKLFAEASSFNECVCVVYDGLSEKYGEWNITLSWKCGQVHFRIRSIKHIFKMAAPPVVPQVDAHFKFKWNIQILIHFHWASN